MFAIASSTTANLHLKLLGTSLADKEKYFEEWRTEINGEGNDSNMNIIDSAYKDMADDIDALDDSKADKTAAVSTIAYDANSKKITKTINGQTTDVVSAADLAGDMDVISDADIDALFAE